MRKEPTAQAACCSRGVGFKLTALGLIVISAVAATGLSRWLRQPEQEPGPASKGRDPRLPDHLFRNWPKPDLAIALTGQQHGYLMPCGCSRPQVGGLERRYNFFQILKDQGWPILPIDLGDVPQMKGIAHLPNVQGIIKYRYAMKAHKLMNYFTVGLGEYEAALPLSKAIDEWALNEPQPNLLLANLLNKEERVDPTGAVHSWKATTVAGVKIGVTSLVGPSTQAKIKDPELTWGDTTATLNPILKEMQAEKVDLRVLLYHGSISRGWKGHPPEAVACAQAFPQFQVVIGLSEEDEPSADPVVVNHKDGGQTFVIGLGQKGKYVGVVGLYRTGRPEKPFDMRYQVVQMSEDFLTPEDQDAGHPIVDLMEEYTTELKNKDYLARIGQSHHHIQVAIPGVIPTYVGSESCKSCHEHAYEVWKKSPHSHAYQTLVDVKRPYGPSNRQYDPECIVCHTVGFGYHTGFTSAKATPHLIDVGCESCHGPCSEHKKNPLDEKWYALINPWRPAVARDKEDPKDKARRVTMMDQFCQKCHDIDNDVTWTHNGFEKKWPKIEHNNPY